MSLDYHYGINIGNRFNDLLGHDEDAEILISKHKAAQEKTNKSVENKTSSKTSTKKQSNKSSSTPPAPIAILTAVPSKSSTNKPNKENVTSTASYADQQQHAQPKPANDNNYQRQPSARAESGRGSRSFRRGGGSAGQDRPPYEGGGRGGGHQRFQRYNKFDGQTRKNETDGFEHSVSTWSNDAENDNQSSNVFHGRGRGRGRGGGRGRGRGRGGQNNRPFEESQQDQQQVQESSGFEQSVQANFDNAQAEATEFSGQEIDVNMAPQERPFQSDGARRGRGHYRARVFRNSRNAGAGRENDSEGFRGNFRQNRRLHDRQQRSAYGTLKAEEKKGGEGSGNWGRRTENPEEIEPAVEATDAGEQPAEAPAKSTDWAKQVDEAERMMTLDEYKKKKEAERQAHHEQVRQFNRREPNEGEDPAKWQNYDRKYQKKDEEEESGEEVESVDEENEDEQDGEEFVGKKKVITIPLHFTRVDRPRGSADSRGGLRRGGPGRYRDQHRSNSPNQEIAPTQPAGEYHNDQQQPRPYRGGARQGSGRGENHRSYGNFTRGLRGNQRRTNADSNTFNFADTNAFPVLGTTAP